MAKERPKGYYVHKKLLVPAKLIGLNYNTFFVFVMASAVMIMLCASKGVIGFIFAAIMIGLTYLGLFIFRQK